MPADKFVRAHDRPNEPSRSAGSLQTDAAPHKQSCFTGGEGVPREWVGAARVMLRGQSYRTVIAVGPWFLQTA